MGWGRNFLIDDQFFTGQQGAIMYVFLNTDLTINFTTRYFVYYYLPIYLFIYIFIVNRAVDVNHILQSSSLHHILYLRLPNEKWSKHGTNVAW